jgi:Rieske Fe-S protein
MPHRMPHDECESCELGRRAFLRDVAAAVGAAAASLGLPAAAARAVTLASRPASRGQTRTYSLPAEDGAVVDRANDVILMRWQGSVYAFSLACPHQNTALRWQSGDARFQCPKHKSRYRPDGTFIEGRATRGMDRFAVRRDGDGVSVDLGRLLKQTDDAAAWAAAVAKV